MFGTSMPQLRTPTASAVGAHILLVGGGSQSSCGLASLLEAHGYRLARADLPAVVGFDRLDVVLFATSPAHAEAVIERCRTLRSAGGPAIVVLYAGADAGYAVRVLEAGADDCLLAPHNPREAVARIRAILRRRGRNARRYGGRHLVFDGWVLDPLKRRVDAPDGRSVELTEAQVRLLAALLVRFGEVISRDDLLDAVLGSETDSLDRAIDVHVSRLKKRLALVGGAELINCCRGIGYRMKVGQVTE